MKVVGFAQLHNELKFWNLHNWFRCMDAVCDYIYIYDQNSTDGSHEVYKQHDKVRCIYSNKNDFKNEIKCKRELLRTLLNEHRDTDWVLWLDGDTILDGRLLRNGGKEFKDLCSSNADAVSFGHHNLWRSDVYARIDDKYDSINERGLVALWRNKPRLGFPDSPGLHHPQHPNGIKLIERCKYDAIHRGFATDEQVLHKYYLYKSMGQNGWRLDRLLNEKGLQVRRVPDDIFPDWYDFTDTETPLNKDPIIDKKH